MKQNFRYLLLVLGGLAAIAAAWFLVMRPRRSKGEDWYSAYSTLKVLDSAEVRYYREDLDRNGIHDYWTGDVAGLYKYGLIDRFIAEADLRPINPLVPKPVPFHGYYFIAMDGDDSDGPSINYRQETDKTSGKVHHLSSFGFCAFTADAMEGGSASHFQIGFINENGTTFWGGQPGMTAPLRRIPRNFRENWAPQ